MDTKPPVPGFSPVPFVQYIRLTGRQRFVFFDCANDIAELAKECIRRGGRFTCEMLLTDEVSLTCEYGGDDIAIVLAQNNRNAADGIADLIRDAHRWLMGPGRLQ